MIFNCYDFLSKSGYKEVSSTYTSIPYRLDTGSQILLKVNKTTWLPQSYRGNSLILVINVYKNTSLKLQRVIHGVASCFENLNDKTKFAQL